MLFTDLSAPVTLSFPASPDPALDIETLRDACLTDDCTASHIEGEIVVSVPLEYAQDIIGKIAADGWLAAV